MRLNNYTYQQSIKEIASRIKVDGGNMLITGATGLIGTVLVDVLRIANNDYGKNFLINVVGRNKENLINRFGLDNRINYFVQDVTKPIRVNKLDYIVHLASNADPESYALFPVETILTNVLGAKNMIDLCRNNNARLLLTSSFEVYGKLEKDEYSEDEFGIIDLNLIRSCYPESKRVSELLLNSYYDEYGVDCVIARLSSVYGPTMKSDDSKAHAQFIRKALEGQDVILKSKGGQLRTYCYVMDAVSGILTILFKGKTGEAYNVANERSIATISEFAHLVADQVGTSVVYNVPDEIEKKGFSKPQNCILKTDKIKNLGWSGKYDLKLGIENTLTIMKELKL